MALDLSAVNWREVGEAIVMGLVAASAATAGARRMLRKGLGELLRPSIQREVGAAVRKTVRDMRKEVTEGLAQQLREAVHEDLAPLREELDELREDLDRFSERIARMEGAMEARSAKPQRQDAPET